MPNATWIHLLNKGNDMADPDDLEKLLADVRRTIAENRQFLEKLVDEADGNCSEVDSGDETEPATAEEEFVEL